MVDLLFSALGDLIAEALNCAVQLIMPLLDFDFDTFNSAFPFAAVAYKIFQSVALAIALILAAVNIIPLLSGQTNNKTSPIRAILSVIISVFAIYYGNYIISAIMEIAQSPYTVIMNADATNPMSFGIDGVTAAINDAAYGVSIIIYIVLMIMIGIAFIKLLLEAVERYVILFVLIYLSPLASSTLASEPTSGIFKRYVSMFISQCVLLILNVWCLKMTISMFDGMMASGNPMLSLLLGYAFLKVAAKLDSYLNQLGLNAAVTGQGLGDEMMAAGMMMMSKLGGLAGGKGVPAGGSSGGSGAASGILGAGQKLTSGIGKVSPVAGAADAGKNALGALGKTAGQGIAAAKGAMNGTSGSLSQKLGAGLAAAGSTMKENVGQNLHAASLKTQGSSLWARGAAQGISKLNGGEAGVDSLVNNAVSGAGLTSEERGDLAANAFVGDKVMNSFGDGDETTEAADVAATMQSIGLEDADAAASDAINAGYGNVQAEDVDYVQNNNGIQASYTKDGWTESWDVKTAAQYNALSPEEQKAYSAFQSKNGGQYYYSHTRNRAPSESQKERMVATSAVAAFSANPENASLSSSEWSAVSKNPDAYNKTWSGLRDSGKTIGSTDTEKASIAGVLSASKAPNAKTTAGRNEAIAYLNSGQAEVAQMNGNGAYVSWTNADGHQSSYSVLTEQGAEAIGATPADLHNAGYEAVDVGGQTYYANYQGTPTKQEQLSEAIAQFTTNPQANPMSSSDYAEMWKNPDQVNQVFSGMAANGTSLVYTPGEKTPENAQIADFISNSKFSGVSSAEKSKAVTSILSGEAKYAKLDGRGVTVEYDVNGEGHRFTVLSPNAVENPAMVAPKVSAGGGSVSNPSATAAMTSKVIQATSAPVQTSTAPNMSVPATTYEASAPIVQSTSTTLPSSSAQVEYSQSAPVQSEYSSPAIPAEPVILDATPAPSYDASSPAISYEAPSTVTAPQTVIPQETVVAAPPPAPTTKPEIPKSSVPSGQKNSTPPKYDLEYIHDRDYQHNTVGNERYYSLTEKHLPTEKTDKATNDLT